MAGYGLEEHAVASSHSKMNGHMEGVIMDGIIPSDSDPPPPLDQSWRSSHANKSMGVLIDRLAQKCFTDLNETLDKLVKPPEPSADSDSDSLSGSVARRVEWMKFAQNQRDRFVKTLVLTDWCRIEQDMAKLVDLRVWEDKQRTAQSNAISFIATIKHNLVTAKMPNPNIEGALGLMGTGKPSPHIPHLGYIPPKPLTARKVLSTLQDMNVALTTRLNLYEELPVHFNQYTVANGRATFRVAQEFEVDLSIAAEDPTSPFYFIDFRFLFSPTASVLNEYFRAALEVRCNAALAGKGLQGCYEYLHNFVLTHKIKLLHSQAMELVQGKWFDCIRLDPRRRILTVQYWSNLPGPKSWLEVGIITGKQKIPGSRKPPTPRLRVRWFREAEEVKDDSVEVDWQNLCLETILSVAIAKHTSWSLRKLQDSLITLAGTQSKLQTTMATSTRDPEICAMTLNLPAMREPLTVRHEPLTGHISLSPPSPLITSIEARLNRDPKLDKPAFIATLLCSIIRERVQRLADLSGWLPGPATARQDNLASLFGKDILIRIMYTCNMRWGADWALVTTFSLSGEKWWVVRLEDRPDGRGRLISASRQIALSDALAPPRISQQYLLHIERMAEAEVSFTTLSKELAVMDIPHRFDRLVSLQVGPRAASPGSSSPVAMHIKSSALLGKSSRQKGSVWNTNIVRVIHESVDSDGSTDDESNGLYHNIRLTANAGGLRNLQDYLARGRHSDIAMSTSGSLALRIRVPFGQPFAEQLRLRLIHAERLDHYLKVVKHQNFRCTSVSISKLAFRYNETPALAVQLLFPQVAGRPTQIRFEPRGSNPHQRIRAVLEKHIDANDRDFFVTFTKTLEMTLPLLQALEQIEAKDATGSSVVVHVRQPTWFSLSYKAPLPPCSWDIRCRTRDFGRKTTFIWHITRVKRPALPTLPASIEDAVKALYQRRAMDWWGVDNAIVTHPSAIGMALDQLDETMRKFEGVEIRPPPEELDTKPLIQQTSVQSAPPPQRPRSQAQPQPHPKTQPQPQAMQRQPSQQRPPPQQMQRQQSQQTAPQMQRQPSLQAAPQMQKQPSQQHAPQMQRQLSHQQQMQMQMHQRQMSQQQLQAQQRSMTPQQRHMLQQQQLQQQLHKSRPVPHNAGHPGQNRPPGAPAPNTQSEPIEID